MTLTSNSNPILNTAIFRRMLARYSFPSLSVTTLSHPDRHLASAWISQKNAHTSAKLARTIRDCCKSCESIITSQSFRKSIRILAAVQEDTSSCFVTKYQFASWNLAFQVPRGTKQGAAATCTLPAAAQEVQRLGPTCQDTTAKGQAIPK